MADDIRFVSVWMAVGSLGNIPSESFKTHYRPPGLSLESRGGSLLASAEDFDLS